MANYKDNTMTIEKQILINHMPLPLELNDILKQFVFITREEKERKRIKASQFILTRIHEIVGQNEIDDEDAELFLDVNKDEIQKMIEDLLDQYEPDYDNVYFDVDHLDSMIMDNYDTLSFGFWLQNGIGR